MLTLYDTPYCIPVYYMGGTDSDPSLIFWKLDFLGFWWNHLQTILNCRSHSKGYKQKFWTLPCCKHPHFVIIKWYCNKKIVPLAKIFRSRGGVWLEILEKNPVATKKLLTGSNFNSFGFTFFLQKSTFCWFKRILQKNIVSLPKIFLTNKSQHFRGGLRGVQPTKNWISYCL